MPKRLDIFLFALTVPTLPILALHLPAWTYPNLIWILALAALTAVSSHGITVQGDISLHYEAVFSFPTLVFLGLPIALWGLLCGQIVEHAIRRAGWRKFFYNTAVGLLQTYALALVLSFLGHASDLLRNPLALTVGSLVYSLINLLGIVTLFSILHEQTWWAVAKSFVPESAPFFLVELSTGLLSVALLGWGGLAWGAVLLVQLAFLWWTLYRYGVTNMVRTKAEYASRYDGLTGLKNRAAFSESLARAELEARTQQKRFALALLDLNGFKAINDNIGHAEGDAALGRFANDLRKCAHKGDVVARLGGDEFVVLMPNTTLAAARARLERLSIPTEYAVDETGKSYPISAAMGIALCPEDGMVGTALLQLADERMYAHKQAMKGTR